MIFIFDNSNSVEKTYDYAKRMHKAGLLSSSDCEALAELFTELAERTKVAERSGKQESKKCTDS